MLQAHRGDWKHKLPKQIFLQKAWINSESFTGRCRGKGCLQLGCSQRHLFGCELAENEASKRKARGTEQNSPWCHDLSLQEAVVPRSISKIPAAPGLQRDETKGLR